jgi:hypothetical protein
MRIWKKLTKTNEDKNINIFFQNWWWGHRDRKNKFKDYSPEKIENSY